MAAKPAAPDEIRMIAKKLSDLRKDYGVWRDGLAAFLGSAICERLHVTTTARSDGTVPDSAEEARAKVVWHLRRLVSGATNESRESARVAFNITQYPELRAMDTIQKRWLWAQERGLCPSRKVFGKQVEAVIADLSRDLGKVQPIPPRKDIETILAEFRGDDLPSEVPAHSRVVEAQQPWWRSLGRPIRTRVSRTMAGVVSGTVASVLAAGVVAGATGIFDSTGTTSRQDALRITLNQVRSSGASWHAVFPVGAQNVDKFVTKDDYPSDPDAFLTDELDAGAYLSGGASVLVEIENYADREVTLYDIRTASKRQEPPILGAAIFVSPTGGKDSPRQINFDLDANPSLPKEARQNWVGSDFFESQRIGLRPGGKESLLLVFTTDRAAYSFDIEFRYELEGKRYTQVLDRSGVPFRVMVDLCRPFQNPELGSAHYTSVRGIYPLDRTGAKYGIRSLDPAHACEERM